MGNGPGELPVRVEHLEVRLGAVQRVGQPADGPQRRRGGGHGRHLSSRRPVRTTRPAERALSQLDPDREPAAHRDRRFRRSSRRSGPRICSGGSTRPRSRAAASCSTEHCAGCHGPHVASDAMTRQVSPARGPDDPLWAIHWKDVHDIGTDPNAAVNFMTNRVDLTRAGLDAGEVQQVLRGTLEKQRTRQLALIASLAGPGEIGARAPRQRPVRTTATPENWNTRRQASATPTTSSPRSISSTCDPCPIGEGLTIVGTLLRNRYYDDHRYSIEARACFDGFDTLDLPQAVPGYKPRPLKGVWATPPFLHNGSVPTIYALLSPREERPADVLRRHTPLRPAPPRLRDRASGRHGGRVRARHRSAGQSQHRARVPEGLRPVRREQASRDAVPGRRHRARADARRALRDHRVPEGRPRRAADTPRAACRPTASHCSTRKQQRRPL